jgi:phosphate starvation-inducible membrane PsiE
MRRHMHTEHLQNVRLSNVLMGWLVAVASGALVLLLLAATGFTGDDSRGAVLADIIVVAVGFGLGGFVAGFRALHAPVLHGIAIGLTSLVAWFCLNLIEALAFPASASGWTSLQPVVAAGLLVEQITFAVAGAWIGYRGALQDQPEPEG